MRQSKSRLPALPAATLAAGLLAVACGGGGGDSGIGFGGVVPPSLGNGAITLSVTDAPIDEAVSAVVQFSGVALRRLNGPETVLRFEQPLRVDLLALQGGQSAPLLPLTNVDAGRYEGMRLLVDASADSLDSFLLLPDGSTRALFIPEGSEQGLEITRGFTVPTGGRAAFTIDFDLRQSVAPPLTPGGAYPLEPQLRLVDDTLAGAIAGQVGPATLASFTCPFPSDPQLNVNLVYVYAGPNVPPDDIDRGGVEPVTTARVAPNAFGAWRYTAAFLPAGLYTVAFTCQGASENPVRSDNLVFLGVTNVLVEPLRTTVANF